jgi:hypothetical protein
MKGSFKTILIAILAAPMLPSCNKSKCDDSNSRRFIVQSPMKVVPQATEIRLGDTLTLTIEIPYRNTDMRDNKPVDIGGYTISEFGIDFGIMNAASSNSLVSEGREQFKILIEKGGGRPYRVSSSQNSFLAEQDRYIYIAKVIPLKKGIVTLANYRAEARDGCTLIDFSPVCINSPNNYDMFYQFGTSIVGPSEYFDLPNRYYIWVK